MAIASGSRLASKREFDLSLRFGFELSIDDCVTRGLREHQGDQPSLEERTAIRYSQEERNGRATK